MKTKLKSCSLSRYSCYSKADFSCQPKTYNQAKYRGWIRWFYLPLAPHISPYLRIVQIRGVFLSCFLLLGYFWGCILATRYQRESAKKKRVSISAKLCLQYSLDSTSHPTSKYFLAGFFHYQVLFQKVLLIIQSCCLKVLVKGGRCNMLANPTALFKFIAALYIGHVS